MRGARGGITGAAGLMTGYAVIIGLADNIVPAITRVMSLWQFLALRSCVALLMLVMIMAVRPTLRLRPRSWQAVVLRAVVHGLSMTCFYAAMAFLPPAQVRAGLFSAPVFAIIFTTLIDRRLPGPAASMGAFCGFAGVLLALPVSGIAAGAGAALGLTAGALYALSNIMTRRTCRDEHALTLTMTYMLASGLIGIAAMALQVTLGSGNGFLSAPAVWPDPLDWLCIAGHAAATLAGVALMLAAYQRADAVRAGVLHYILLPVAGIWSWLLLGWVPSAPEAAGMMLIAASGVIVLADGKRPLRRPFFGRRSGRRTARPARPFRATGTAG